MDKFIQIFCDLFVLHDKVHVAHMNTVKMSWCATIHPTLGAIYESLDELVDKFWEDVIIKYSKWKLPWFKECIAKSTIWDNVDGNPQKIVRDLYMDCEKLEATLGDENNKADNNLAQLIGPIREKFTVFCADLEREQVDEDIEDLFKITWATGGWIETPEEEKTEDAQD